MKRCVIHTIMNKKLYLREYNLKKKYGLTLKDYDQMSHEQGHVCAICGRSERSQNSRGTGIKSLAVDHCHATGTIRGLLCELCNRGLGWYETHKEEIGKYLDNEFSVRKIPCVSREQTKPKT